MDRQIPPQMQMNEFLVRSRLAAQMNTENKDINQECSYPERSIEAYRILSTRGVGKRIVEMYPQECWQQDPQVYETEDDEETLWEQMWGELVAKHKLYSSLLNADILSGVGHYGATLFGLDDGAPLHVPVDGVDPLGKSIAPAALGRYNLLFLRTFDEYLAPISKYETDVTSPRYGLPVFYDITFHDPTETSPSASTAGADMTTKTVHWTRVQHIAEDTRSSMVFGTPRLDDVFEPVYDVKKVASGSGEMYWKGAFPGIFFGGDADYDSDFDVQSIKDQIFQYENSLKRWLAMQGVTPTQLSPNVADPTTFVEAQLRLISVIKAIPLRMLMGSEQAQLASGQDSTNWNRKLSRRQSKHIDCNIIKPFADHLALLGLLPPDVTPIITWPDLDAPSDHDKAQTAVVATEALSKYVQGNVEALIPPQEYFVHIMGWSPEKAEAVLDAAIENNPDADPNDTLTIDSFDTKLQRDVQRTQTMQAAAPTPAPAPIPPKAVPAQAPPKPAPKK